VYQRESRIRAGETRKQHSKAAAAAGAAKGGGSEVLVMISYLISYSISHHMYMAL
jgi:hypothetical protein